MAKKNKFDDAIDEPIVTAHAEETALEPIGSDLRDLFNRTPTDVGPVRTLHMKRTLTRSLVSMSKRKQLAVQCQSEIYIMDLPLKGRSGGMSQVRVFDARELVPGEIGFTNGDEIIVVCHEVMCSALARAGYQSIKTSDSVDSPVLYEPVPGNTLTGALLGFVSGDIEDGKRYRSIYVAELE